jgi:hypothetical protein
MADIPAVGSQRYKEYTTALKLGQDYTPGQGAGTALKNAADITGYNWTGPLSGQRFAEFLSATRLGQKYTPGQAAGTALSAFNATKASKPPVDATGKLTGYKIENDPYFQNALAAGQSEFNLARNQALFDLQNQQTQADTNLRSLDKSSAQARTRLAGNYAARGMAGGSAGALALAEARANAEQIASQTSIKDQIASLNQNYLANYGATGTDWTGTLLGQKYKTAAIQQALQSRLGQMGL